MMMMVMMKVVSLSGSVFDGSKIEVVLAKPVERDTYHYVKSAKAAATQVTYIFIRYEVRGVAN